MTVCIAAVCDDGVLAVSDTMITGSFVQADKMSLKVDFLKGGWLVMLAANDITDAEPVLDRVNAALSTGDQIQEVERAFAEAYVEERKHRAENHILGVYGFTMDKFLQSRKDLGEQVFYELIRKIELTETECEFLVVGMQQDSRPHILHVDGLGRVRRYSRVGFAAIGSGSHLATSSLFLYGYNDVTPFNRAVYLISQAKFTAESAPGVGIDTFVFARKKGAQWKFVPFKEFEKVREIWSGSGKPKVPSGIDTLVGGLEWKEI